jgi:solute carrier family 1 (high affinity glutamate transporter) protein 2
MRYCAGLIPIAPHLFCLQAHGLELSVGKVIVIAISATLAAIGTASIPNGALVSLVSVLQVSVFLLPETCALPVRFWILKDGNL